MSHMKTHENPYEEWDEVADFTPLGPFESVFLRAYPAPYRVLFYPDGTVRFEHDCKIVDRVRIICAPSLVNHTIVQREPLTIEASILCPDCGTHGWVRKGRWVAA